MHTAADTQPLIEDELELLSALVPLDGLDIVELGCGAAKLARSLLQRFPGSLVTGLDVDVQQHAKNLAAPQPGLHFVAGGAQAIPFADGSFDLVLMLKSLHHVPMPLLGQALGEALRVLRPGGLLYVSEPVYAGLDAALRTSHWTQVAERRFQTTLHFSDFDAFERQLMRPTFADHRIDDAKLAAVRSAFAPHLGAGGARFQRPMHVRLLRRLG